MSTQQPGQCKDRELPRPSFHRSKAVLTNQRTRLDVPCRQELSSTQRIALSLQAAPQASSRSLSGYQRDKDHSFPPQVHPAFDRNHNRKLVAEIKLRQPLQVRDRPTHSAQSRKKSRHLGVLILMSWRRRTVCSVLKHLKTTPRTWQRQLRTTPVRLEVVVKNFYRTKREVTILKRLDVGLNTRILNTLKIVLLAKLVTPLLRQVNLHIYSLQKLEEAHFEEYWWKDNKFS